MKINSVNLIDLIPPYMQNDATVIGLCAAADYIFSELYTCILKMDFFEGLELLSDNDLDYIAQAMNIVWYDSSSTKEVKISIIKNAENVFWILGTVSAAEKVINDIFGECEIKEWFDYTGAPYHFKIVTYNSQISGDAVDTFNKVISYVKRKSAILDAVEITLAASINMYCGISLLTGDTISIKQEG